MSQMYHNRRRVRTRVSDDVVMRDAMTETRDLCISVLHMGASSLYVSHVVTVLLDVMSSQSMQT
jgi:hypothetical protein